MIYHFQTLKNGDQQGSLWQCKSICWNYIYKM